MIPIRDVIPTRTIPWVALGCVLVLAAAFAWVLTRTPEERIELQLLNGLTPGLLTWQGVLLAPLLHASTMALAANLLVIAVLGEAVEDRLGHLRTLLLMLISTIVAAVVLAGARPSPYPVIGATATAASVIGAHLALFRSSRVLIRLPLASDAAEIPSLMLVAAWFVLNASALGPIDVGVAGRSIFTLELTGAACGAVGAFLLRLRSRASPDWWSPLGRGLLS